MDVTFSNKTASGLRIHARSNIVNALGAPFIIDYDDVVDARLFLPLHLIDPPPKAFLPPPYFLHPAIPCLEQFRSRLVLQEELEPPRREMDSPPPLRDPKASTSTDSGIDVWNPEHDDKLPTADMDSRNPQADKRVRPLRTGPGFEWWRSHHRSQHDLYNLLPDVTECLSFQVTLTGTIPDLNGKFYDGSKPFDIFLWRHGNSERRWLTIKWQQLRGRIPPDMIIGLIRPTKKTKLPMLAVHGEHEGSLLTKVTAIREEIWALPVDPQLGKVHETWQLIKILPVDCCVVRLLNSAAHEVWSKFNPKSR
ncbi:hypothetical protein E1B28_011947 [Marasmius oreades]|uniref:Uncharacterized protein n=1 Tax=Marasmius oreades TaxID=181124 RepID=A0A9P7RQM2_9AGAR|nr:uncharacterized protein E1B28_011947 [Marasmius oreades]KAG7087900.1 hypothetical protein E1B28_011947 [Marasmius oreades]